MDSDSIFEVLLYNIDLQVGPGPRFTYGHMQ